MTAVRWTEPLLTPPLMGCEHVMAVKIFLKGKRSRSMVSSLFFSCQASESTLPRVCPGAPPEVVPPARPGAGESAPSAPVSLTGTDGGKVSHVVEQLADDRTGPGVQSVTVDAQVELDPAGLESELQRGVQGSEVQLLFVYLVSSERDFFFFQLEKHECKDLPKCLVWTPHPLLHSLSKSE